MTGGRRNGRHHEWCPACRATLAYIRPEMLILRRLTVTDAARKIERDGDTVTITCRCGHTHEIRWSLLQR